MFLTHFVTCCIQVILQNLTLVVAMIRVGVLVLTGTWFWFIGFANHVASSNSDLSIYSRSTQWLMEDAIVHWFSGELNRSLVPFWGQAIIPLSPLLPPSPLKKKEKEKKNSPRSYFPEQNPSLFLLHNIPLHPPKQNALVLKWHFVKRTSSFHYKFTRIYATKD